jgi:myotubularin-related protein 1/2
LTRRAVLSLHIVVMDGIAPLSSVLWRSFFWIPFTVGIEDLLIALLSYIFYFTGSIRGFEVLIEKEWLSFGHMFGARSGHGSHEYESAPIFLLFLDAVFQATRQFPKSFEFNEFFLLTIMDSVFSCRFGTFLCNSEKERAQADLRTKTVSLWAYINSNAAMFTNPHYNPPPHSPWVLVPCIHFPALVFWSTCYLRWNRKIH